MTEYPATRISVEQIDALLPQTQCGRCDQPGCLPYARAVAAGDAHNLCPPGGQVTVDALADLLDRPRLPVHNDGCEDADQRTVAYIREDECIGCTKCIQACPVDAIVGAARLMHTVIVDECTGCDLCVAPCPVDCIDMLPVAEPPYTWLEPRPDQGGEPVPLTPAARQARVRADRARRRFRAREARRQRDREEKAARHRARLKVHRAPQPADDTLTSPTAAQRQKTLQTLKTAYNIAHKQYKQARAALERAERGGVAELDTMHAKVAALRERAEYHRQSLDALMNDAKAALAAATGKDLKTLKLEAARAESALVDQQRRLERLLEEDTDPAARAELERELRARQGDANGARLALRQALEAQGLND